MRTISVLLGEQSNLRSQTEHYCDGAYVVVCIGNAFEIRLSARVTFDFLAGYVPSLTVLTEENISIQDSATAAAASMSISLIVPIYKVERFIAQCISSALDQLPDHCEIVCVNDSSPDDSLHVLQRLLRNYPEQLTQRVKIISHDANRGLSAARNTGLNYAAGTFVGFLDSDDFLRPNYFDTLLKILARLPNVDIISFNALTVSARSAAEGYGPSGALTLNDMDRIWDTSLDRDENLFLAMVGRGLWYAPLRLYRRSLFNEHRFPEGLFYEDLFLVPKLYFEASQVFFSTARLMSIRANAESIQSNPSAKHVADLYSIADHYVQLSKTADSEFLSSVSFITACNALFVAAETQSRIRYGRGIKQPIENLKRHYGKKYFDSKLKLIEAFQSREKRALLRTPRNGPAIFYALKTRARVSRLINRARTIAPLRNLFS